MSFVWEDINNGDNTSEIRKTLNKLGVNISDIVKFYTNIFVDMDEGVRDNTYVDFPYRIDISINNITDIDIPIVIFPQEQALSGNFIGAVSATNKVSIWYHTSYNQNDFTIPFIGFIKQDVIPFYIVYIGADDVLYAKRGMTWKEWCSSAYNKEQFDCGQEYVFTPAGANYITYNGAKVKATDMIIENAVYTIDEY